MKKHNGRWKEYPLNHNQRFLKLLYVVLKKLLDHLPILNFSIRQQDWVRVVGQIPTGVTKPSPLHRPSRPEAGH